MLLGPVDDGSDPGSVGRHAVLKLAPVVEPQSVDVGLDAAEQRCGAR